jgi:hypothetical protein
MFAACGLTGAAVGVCVPWPAADPLLSHQPGGGPAGAGGKEWNV